MLRTLKTIHQFEEVRVKEVNPKLTTYDIEGDYFINYSFLSNYLKACPSFLEMITQEVEVLCLLRRDSEYHLLLELETTLDLAIQCLYEIRFIESGNNAMGLQYSKLVFALAYASCYLPK